MGPKGAKGGGPRGGEGRRGPSQVSPLFSGYAQDLKA